MAQSKADFRTMNGMSGASKAEKGRVIHNRRIAAGIKSLNQFTNLMRQSTTIDRSTLTKVEKGDPTVEDDTFDRVMAWLDEYVGEPDAAERVVTFEAHGLYGVARVSVAGPVEDAAELEERFARILDRLLAGQRDTSSDGGGST